jgi:peroxiredoxin
MCKNFVREGLPNENARCRWLISAVVLFMLLFSTSWAGTLPGAFHTEGHPAPMLQGPAVGTRVGQLAPDFTLVDVQGRPRSLSEFRGQEVLLVFWSIHCPHCTAKVSLLNAVNADGLKVLAVAVGTRSTQLARYIGDSKIEFDILSDANGTVAKAYGVSSVPQPFWIDVDGTILLSGSEHGSGIWASLGGQDVRADAPAELVAYVVPYMGDIDGGINEEWYAFYDRVRRWHDDNAMPGSFSFYPDTMDDPRFNKILGDMYTSENIELILKGEDTYQGRRLDLMTYAEVKQALQAWQNMFVSGLEQVGYSNVELPVAYNQLLQRFNETTRDAAHDVGFQIYFEQGVSDEYGYVDMLPDFDITQYSVALTTTGLPGPETVFRSVQEIIQDILDFDDERLIFIDGVKVVPLLCHQQDFRVSEESSEVDETKFGTYTELLTTLRSDPRIRLIRPREVYQLRHGSPRNYILTDFETADHGWMAEGTGQGRFEIGPPVPFDPSEGACWTDCFGTGPSEDHSAFGVNAACTNLDGHMAPLEDVYTNSLTSPVYDFTGRRNVGLELWTFMEIEGLNFDLCYFQYKNDPLGEWTTFETYGANAEDSDDWTAYAHDLSGVADGKSYFQLRFYCTTDDWFEGSGLCVDDILISWSKAADFNGDDEIDFLDYAGLAGAWQTRSGGADKTYDLSGDGIVDVGDLVELANDWLSEGYSSRPVVKKPDRSIKICDWQGCAAGAASVSIDDSYPSCRDILNQNGFRGTYYLAWTDTFSEAEWDMWRSIYAEGHELGGHTTTHGSSNILEDEILRWELSSNRNDILTNVGMPEEELTSFAWPRGDATAESEAIASEYFLSARGYHVNELEEKDPADFMYLKSLNTPHYHDPQYDPPDYFQKADEAEALGKWVIFVFHNECLDDGAISYLTTKDLWVAPVGTVVKYIKERQSAQIIDVVQTQSEVSCTLASSLDPHQFNQKLTIRVAVKPASVQVVLVNGKAAAFTQGVDHILMNVRPSGSDEIRIVLGQTANQQAGDVPADAM